MEKIYFEEVRRWLTEKRIRVELMKRTLKCCMRSDGVINNSETGANKKKEERYLESFSEVIVEKNNYGKNGLILRAENPEVLIEMREERKLIKAMRKRKK